MHLVFKGIEMGLIVGLACLAIISFALALAGPRGH